jgi:hypothetical protein
MVIVTVSDCYQITEAWNDLDVGSLLRGAPNRSARSRIALSLARIKTTLSARRSSISQTRTGVNFQYPSGSAPSGVLARFDDQPITAFCTDVCPGPLEKDAEPQATLSQKLYVDQSPDEPREETTHHDAPTLQHGKILADNGKVALVEVAKRGKLWFLDHLPKD